MGKKALMNQIACSVVFAQVVIAMDDPQLSSNQGTIGRQRSLLTEYSATGWLSDHADPRFWFWDLGDLENGGAYAPSDNRYPGARRWAQQWLNPATEYYLLNGDVDDCEVEILADNIINKIEQRIDAGDIVSNSPSTFAMFIQGIGFPGDLIAHESDKLHNVPENQAGAIYPWEFYTSSNELRDHDSEYKGTPWRSAGVSQHHEFFVALMAALEYKIGLYNDDVANVDKIPDPSRFFVDHELSWGLGNGAEVIAVYNSTIRDSTRFSTETLYGDFSNWTSNTDPKASDIMGGFNPNYSATAHSWYGYFPIPNSLDDVNQLRDTTIHRSMINAVMDGVFEASMGDELHSTWQGIMWSNYGVSGWYSEQYPSFTRGSTGGVAQNLWNPHLYGWNFRAWYGSADMQSPVLYPPHASQTSEFENPNYPSVPSTDDQVMEAGVRLSRLQLDHAIFSFSGITKAPRHIVPWMPHVGSPVNSGAIAEVSKKYTRDIIALCKAKGINELIFWGNTTTHTKSKDRWIATNDALSQVWDYNLKSIRVWPGNSLLTAAQLEEMEFSEEHAFDLDVLDATVTSVTAEMEVEFDVAENLNPGAEYTLILEALDGGGPWADADYALKIRNFQTGAYGAYETVSAVYQEMNDISTRRVVFLHEDSDLLYDDWEHQFDDESAAIPNVQDRKSIHKWIITLPSGSLNDYLFEHPSQGWKKMKFQIIATHDSPPLFGQPDPLRIDLLQLYESELIDDNVQHLLTTELAGHDFNHDGATSFVDLIQYLHAMGADKADLALDINQDGQVDASDLAEICNAVYND